MFDLNVVNLFGGPGSGKSTTAAELFVEMKKAGMSVELVTEYAKDMTWEKRQNILSDQQYVFTKQYRRLSRLAGQVEWIVTDSALLFSIVYGDPTDTEFHRLVMDRWHNFRNINFFLPRNPQFKFHQEGRNQNEAEASALDARVVQILPPGTRHINVTNGDYVGQIIKALGFPIVREIDVARRIIPSLAEDAGLTDFELLTAIGTVRKRLAEERSSLDVA